MSRWIDADALKEKYTMATKRYSGGIMERPVVLLETIDEAPSIDIVRCKECIYGKLREVDGKQQVYCDYQFDWWNMDGFCSYGERRE